MTLGAPLLTTILAAATPAAEVPAQVAVPAPGLIYSQAERDQELALNQPPQAVWESGEAQPEIEPPPEFPADEDLQDGQRRRPGVPDDYRDPAPGDPDSDLRRERANQNNPGAIRSPPPEAYSIGNVPIPDRWRLIETLGIVREDYLDPYNQNTLKGDRPMCTPELARMGEETIAEAARLRAEAAPGSDEANRADALMRSDQVRHRRAPGCRLFDALGLGGDDWFFVGSAISDTVIEPRSFPIPVGVQTTDRPGNNDVFGINRSLVTAQTFILSAALIKGNTAYRPPNIEYRLTLAVQANYVDVSERRVLFVEPTRGTSRIDTWIGVQEAFIDYHFRDVSYRYDFDSIRIGIQPLQFDFRGFLFQDQQLAVRLFGNRDNNRLQYNLIGVWRLEKDTNSGLNDVTASPRNDWIIHANVFRQDLPVVGLTSELSLTYNINREGDDIHIDDNGFPVRPALFGDLRGRDYDVFYVGYNADGRIGRINLTASLSYVYGWERHNVFTGRDATISGYFAAFEPSYDFNWIRLRGAAMISSGDSDPYDDTQAGYDAIFENPIFAGADTSYWIRQTIPFAGGGRAVSLVQRNGILANLRSSKEEGQSNFVNPGTLLLGIGADFDITPDFRLSANANHLWFQTTEVLQALRVEGTIPNEIGFDLSAAAIYRPNFNQNLVFRLSGAVLIPTAGFNDLFANQGRDDFYYSILFNAILTY